VEAFFTGSRMYGIPTPTSDLDLVVLMSEEVRVGLMIDYGWPIKVGSLNIIPCTSEVEMLAWKKATEVCIATAGSGVLKKEDAIKIHEAWRKQYGVPERDMGGSGATIEEQQEIDSAKQEARERRADGYFDRNGQYR
jgi:hypothetical protein